MKMREVQKRKAIACSEEAPFAPSTDKANRKRGLRLIYYPTAQPGIRRRGGKEPDVVPKEIGFMHNPWSMQALSLSAFMHVRASLRLS
jgi:hypothetical protein